MISKEDRMLYGKIITGDQAAITLFYTRHESTLRTFIEKKLGSSEHTDEILQDAFIGFFEALRSFRAQCSLKTFLYAIAGKKVLSHIRKKRLKQYMFSHLPVYVIESLTAVWADDGITSRELAEKIERSIGGLPHDYQVALRLKYVEGRKVPHIAHHLNLSFKAAESLLFRARKAFIKSYGIYDG